MVSVRTTRQIERKPTAPKVDLGGLFPSHFTLTRRGYRVSKGECIWIFSYKKVVGWKTFNTILAVGLKSHTACDL